MRRLLRQIMADSSAATAVEYGLFLGVFSLSLIFGLKAFSNQLFVLWHRVENASTNASQHL